MFAALRLIELIASVAASERLRPRYYAIGASSLFAKLGHLSPSARFISQLSTDCYNFVDQPPLAPFILQSDFSKHKVRWNICINILRKQIVIVQEKAVRKQDDWVEVRPHDSRRLAAAQLFN
jgi:hypothetical protein